MQLHHSGLLGCGRIPGSLGMRPILKFRSAPVESDPAIRIFEPQPVSGWTPELQMSDFAIPARDGGRAILFVLPSTFHFLPPRSVDEVRQGHTGNCPVVATLAALAHAAPARILRMFSFRTAKVQSEVIDTSETLPMHITKKTKERTLFTVGFAGGSAEVSGLLWNRDGALEYASSTNGTLWPSIFEKAYVVAHGGNSYNTIFGTVTPHEAMTNMLGPVDELVLASNPSTLASTLRQADRRPTIADTLTSLPAIGGIPAGIIGFHTYAVLDLRGNKVEVYNVLDGAHIQVPLRIFEQVFETVVQHRG